MFCGLFMDELNEGFSLSPETMSALASRKVSIRSTSTPTTRRKSNRWFASESGTGHGRRGAMQEAPYRPANHAIKLAEQPG